MTRRLSDEQIHEVWLALGRGDSTRVLAKRYGVSNGCIQHQRENLMGGTVKRTVAPKVKCQGCDKMISSAKARKYCSAECREAAIEAERELNLAEFLWIAGTDTPENVTRRLGYGSPRYLARFLFRCGELEWARKFEQAETPYENRRAA